MVANIIEFLIVMSVLVAIVYAVDRVFTMNSRSDSKLSTKSIRFIRSDFRIVHPNQSEIYSHYVP